MQRPAPRKHSVCDGCDKRSELLMPCGFAPGAPVIVWQLLCLDCRMSERSDEWCMTADDLKHHRRPETRAIYPEWLQATV